MLPSLRPLIAESMRLNANASELRYPEWMAVLRGAETLEWCDANDPDNAPDPTDSEMLDQIEAIAMRDQSDELAITQIRDVLGI